MILDVNDFSCSFKKKYIVSYNCMCKSYHRDEEDNFMNSHLNVVKYYDDEFSDTDEDDDIDNETEEDSEEEIISGRELIEREAEGDEDDDENTDTDMDIDETTNIVENTHYVFSPSYNIIGVHHVESNDS